jgi:tetraacyldisaccharide 4'-kinase
MTEDFFIRLLLLPFSLLYGIVISVRELFYRFGIVKSVRFSIPVIGIGNLSVGGTGKTPHTEYLLMWLQQYIQVAALSRGYGRSTVGIREVHTLDKPESVGDEPLQMKRKYPDVPVFVAENRVFGIPAIVQRHPDMQCVVLDDAFQHRGVQPGKQILLTEYGRPYTRDWLLPAGRLREWRNGAQRADIIIVTKCPPQLSTEQRAAMIAEIAPASYQKVYFSTYLLGQPYHLQHGTRSLRLDQDTEVLLVSAIAGTEYLISQVEPHVGRVRSVSFKDHHVFETDDFEVIRRDYGYMQGKHKVVLCTEKDAVKLERFLPQFAAAGMDVHVLPVRVQFLDQDEAAFQAEMQQFLSEFRA